MVGTISLAHCTQTHTYTYCTHSLYTHTRTHTETNITGTHTYTHRNRSSGLKAIYKMGLLDFTPLLAKNSV